MQAFQNPDTNREQRRAAIARDLATLYSDLANPKPQERFSLVKMLKAMSLREFHSGNSHEANVCDAAAQAQGGAHDPQRAIVPWGALATRDLNTATSSAGGNLVGANTVGALDVLRPYSVTARMGVTAADNLLQNLLIPNITTSVTGQWLATETSPITNTDPVIGVISSKPKTAGAVMKASRQFLLQTDQAEAVIRQQLLAAMGALLDQAVLQGTGASGQPTGLSLVSGVGAQSGAVTWASVCDILETLGNAKAEDDNIQLLSTPSVRRLLQAREIVATSGRMIWEDRQVAGMPAKVTTDCPASTIFAGDWSNCQVAFWGQGLRIDVDPYTSFVNGVVQVRVLMFVDVNFPKPAAFFRYTSVT